MKLFHKRPSTSMRGIMLVSMIGLTTVTIFAFALLVLFSKIRPSLEDASYRTLYNQAATQASRLETEFNDIAKSTWQMGETLSLQMDRLLEAEGVAFQQLRGRPELIDGYIAAAYGTMTNLPYGQSVSGVFVILEAGYETERGNGKAALYLRNTMAVTASAKSATTLLRGPVRIPELSNLALEKNWSYDHSVEDETASQFYFKPLEAARTYPKAEPRDLGYWSSRFRISPTDVEIITYSLPVIGADGEVYGVCGIELSMAGLSRIAPEERLSYQGGFYLLGRVADDALIVDSMITKDASGSRFLMEAAGDIPLRKVSRSSAYQIYRLEGTRSDFMAAVTELKIYGRNSPFSGEGYSLSAVVPRMELFSLSNSITASLFWMLAASAILSAAGAAVLSGFFAGRIENLAGEAADLSPERPAVLSRTGIREIDLLSEVLEQLNADVAAHAARMSTIVDSVDMPMGAFEISLAKDTVFLTNSLFRLLDIPHGIDDSQHLTGEEFREMLPQVFAPEGDGSGIDFYWCSAHTGSEKWLRLRRTAGPDYISGTVLDISEEVRQKERLEYERNYDPLTNLLNRNACTERMTGAIREQPGRMGVLLFGDLDNLKSVNDTFGHDAGDRYIQLAAEALGRLGDEGGIVARISGDEFAAYLHGGGSRKELRARVDSVLERTRAMQMAMPDGSIQKVCISIGLAYYPEDADNIDDLMHYADFAMYEIKHSSKGGTNEFNRYSYERNSYILEHPSQLNLLLEQRRIKFAFQPIADVRSGEIIAYEALMRPQMRELKTPGQVISLARSQSRLPQLERMALSTLFDWIQDNPAESGGRTLFFNSLPGQLPHEDNFSGMRDCIQKLGCKLVMEITEEEEGAPDQLRQKVQLARRAGVRIALCNYRSGCSGAVELIGLRPDYIKIDMSIVRGIDSNECKQSMMKSMVDYAARYGMRVISEGVETPEEMRTVIALGTHYVQGFYLCHPEYQLLEKLPGSVREEVQSLYTQGFSAAGPPESEKQQGKM